MNYKSQLGFMNNFDCFKSQTSSNQNSNLGNEYSKSKYSSENFWDVDPVLLSDNFLDSTVNKNFISHGLTNTSNYYDNNTNIQSIYKHNRSLTTLDEADTRSMSTNSSSKHTILGKDKFKNNSFKCKKVLRKLPIHFIDSKDWQLYLEFASLRNTNTDNSKVTRLKNNKVHRLLTSFYNLYQNYADLYEDYESLCVKMNDICNNLTDDNSSMGSNDPLANLHDSKIRKSKLKSSTSSRIISKESSDDNHTNIDILRGNQFINSSAQTCPVPEWSELDDDQLVDLFSNSDTGLYLNQINYSKYCRTMPNSVINRKSNITLPLEDGLVRKRSKNFDDFQLNNKKYKVYDRLTRHNFLGHQDVDIVEELHQNSPRVTHRMNLVPESRSNCNISLSSEDCSQNELSNPAFFLNSITNAFRFNRHKHINNRMNNCNNLSLINIPILMDALLPKVQLKIKYIFDKCPFLSNPLEVMAELRYFNYNKQSTVEYFKVTKRLRDSLKEFLKINVETNIKTMIIRSLYQGDIHQLPDTNENMYEKVGLMACSNCGRDLITGDNLIDKSLTSLAEKESVLYGTNSTHHISMSTDALNSTLMRSDKNLMESLSKYTDIEPGFFDNSIQDSFTQTLATKEFRNKQSDFVVVIKKFNEKCTKTMIHLRRSIKESKVQMTQLKRQVSSLLKALRSNIDLIVSLSGKQFLSDQHKGRIVMLARQVEELKIKLKDEETKRRLVYNLMQEQMGNVRVYCRCRDIPHNENVLEIHDSESIVLPISPQEKFVFDKVFSSSMSQHDIYDEFQPLVMSFIDGFNVCFITYGSEASGKTYTLIGGKSEVESENGIMQRALTTLLSEQRSRSRDWEYQIGACLVEIYNDNCIDLLSGEGGIQLYVDCGMETVYQKLRSVPVTSESDAEVLVQLCRAKRKVARTALNPASSRSHLITLIRLQGLSKIHGESIRSFMCLCDLAGFEDIIKAETQSSKTLSKEAGYINRSLTAFNRVFVSLRRQDPNTVCYRDTKLTHLLKPFLTNSGKCALIITVRTDRRSLSSTQNTLRFGRETRGVSLGKARRQQFNPPPPSMGNTNN